MSLDRVNSGDKSDKTCFTVGHYVSVSLSSAVLCVGCRDIEEEALVELAAQATPSLLIHTHTHTHTSYLLLWNETVLAQSPRHRD